MTRSALVEPPLVAPLAVKGLEGPANRQFACAAKPKEVALP